MAETTSPKFYIKSATTPQDLEHTKELFTTYADSLPISLTFQNFDAEIASLPGLYSPPTGAIFLAYPNPPSNYPESQMAEPIGVIALRPLPNTHPTSKICEMKRLYLAPASRGLGIGKRLAAEVITEAKRLGYVEMRLDTLPSMVGARALYKGLGFVETEKYYNTPIEGTMFLSKDLRG
jgi:ribosomal protein S18 acetylase RimI-like enzyme